MSTDKLTIDFIRVRDGSPRGAWPFADAEAAASSALIDPVADVARAVAVLQKRTGPEPISTASLTSGGHSFQPYPESGFNDLRCGVCHLLISEDLLRLAQPDLLDRSLRLVQCAPRKWDGLKPAFTSDGEMITVEAK